MRHPNEATLALYAGDDLGPVRRWLTARHVERCAACREEVAAYDEMRELLPELAELPEISWNRMTAEIKANIRLGLEAGECVRGSEMPRRRASMVGWRAAVAFGSVAALLLGCFAIEHPAPMAPRSTESAVIATRDGVEVQKGGQNMLGLMNGGAQNVIYTMDAQGSMGARYTDPETGSVTINTVYAQ